MMTFGDYSHHWSYYLAIEEQLRDTARYVEFSTENAETYSIEFARILLSASSEADVLLKQLCHLLDSNAKADSINKYQLIIINYSPKLINESVYARQYNIELKPWENLSLPNNPPTWWTANNKVKHHRNTHFKDANLRNAMHAVGALHILVVYYYKVYFEKEGGHSVTFGSVTNALQPRSSLYSLSGDYYSGTRVINSAL
ncbi:hypothetical protein [Hymenobacter bucti]|uniref:Uncharacterized protein n=1 Tax=Hymenobacter bucti TaxID=1844114 RepID=A0ABW4QZC5_9BACT